MSQPPQPPAQHSPPAPEAGQPGYGWPPQAAAPHGAPPPPPWAQQWPTPVFPGPPGLEPRSTAKDPLVLTLVALGALLAGGVAGFLIAAVAFMSGGMGWGMGAGMEEGLLGPVEEFPAVPPGDMGPDPVLDEYADACFAGDFQACDDLMYESPPLSQYEEYGATCGGRVKPYSVLACTDLE